MPLFNTLKVFFETAEGYKKCSEAAVGPWSRLRWRRWSWSEFRFETHFVTPKFTLQNISKKRVKEWSYRERFLTLRDRTPAKINKERLWRRVVLTLFGARGPTTRSYTKKSRPWYWYIPPEHWIIFSSGRRAKALFHSYEVLDASLGYEVNHRNRGYATWLFAKVKRWKRRVKLDHEAAAGLREELGIDIRFLSEQRVSWLSFLRHLHHSQYERSVNPAAGLFNYRDLLSTWLEFVMGPKQFPTNPDELRYETGVSVSFVECTWDSLPAKATRPMASTNLGTLVVMAVRLGMEWRIDLEKDVFQASGNGYSLSCTQWSEIGLVASFTAEEKSEHEANSEALDRFSQCLPIAANRPADMLMCGIIPGSRYLVNENFYCTDDSRKTDVWNAVLDVIDHGGWLRERLPPENTPDENHSRWVDMAAKEMMALLCEFVPSVSRRDKGDTEDKVTNEYIFADWTGSQTLPSSCPLASMQGFRTLLDFGGESEANSQITSEFYEFMRTLQDDRYRVTGNEPLFVERTQLSEIVYERTTYWWMENFMCTQKVGQSYYVRMVAAHCYMSHKAWQATIGCLKRPCTSSQADDGHEGSHGNYGGQMNDGGQKGDGERKGDGDQEDYSDQKGNASQISDGSPKKDDEPRIKSVRVRNKFFEWREDTPPRNVEMGVFSMHYLEEVCNPNGGLMQYLTAFPFPDRPDAKEHVHQYYIDAWLVMMLRGFSWTMSVTRRKGAGSGEAIPSSCWDNQRPIWII